MGQAVTPHPAKFSDAIIEAITRWIPAGSVLLDPFAGVGRIHELRPEVETWGVEIEEEWATQSEWTILGDATTDLGDVAEAHALHYGFDVIATSPSYGNRMADKHNARERCRQCDGLGVRAGTCGTGARDCSACDATGQRDHKRVTYKHVLGRELHPNNTGGMQWGESYRVLHYSAWREAVAVLREGGRFILNCKDHIRGGERQRVTAWHASALLDLGLELLGVERVPCRGMRFGANAHKRVDYESVIVFEKP